ncbi:hypothetical protein N7478_005136 [Penicillium angulare]|uniref:uncharacterized protein n=1 Tax=Penicillium angulare TaxID=116970 RepID=UPI0025408921|nr:uncharacterized protein N7478_005136 [Penicillium angulare]KAJ5279764.1 hypothetical protein N7478_005136 [Penicillium angulare]
MGPVQSASAKELEHEKWENNLRKQYSGHWHWSSGVKFKRPPKLSPEQFNDRVIELEHESTTMSKRRYLNPTGDDEHEKFPDLDTYYSSTKEIPRRLVVQATKDARNDSRPRHWAHTHIDGRTPFIIRLAELCVNPLGLERYDSGYVDDDDDDEDSERVKLSGARRVWSIFLRILHYILSIFFTLTLAWIIQGLLSVQVITEPWSSEGSENTYEEYDNVHWDWPKHAINALDQSPGNPRPQSNITRLTIPRRLVVWDKEKSEWVARDTTQLRDKTTGILQPYIFLSFSRGNYPADDDTLRPFFHKVAQSILDRENAHRDPRDAPVEAFWVDTDCVSHATKAEETRDINTICDAVRCARRVYILLPTNDKKEKEIWGKRIWTLPEVLLAAEKIRYCITPSWPGDLSNTMHSTVNYFEDVALTDMYSSFWPLLPPVSKEPSGECNGERHEDAISHLIDHYTNRTKLSELQLFTFAVQAMAQLSVGSNVEGYTTTSMAYAAMGLLSYRITPDDNDDTFQAIARLSLVNDSNQLLERLLCLWPDYTPTGSAQKIAKGEEKYAVAGSESLLRNIADQDQYSVHLWDIQPSCDVVGIGNDKFTPTVIMDRCKGVPIRWKSFPQVRYAQNFRGFRANISQIVVYCGAWFLLAGFNLFATVISLAFASVDSGQTINIDQYMYGIALYVGVSWIISWFSPRAVRQLCSGGSSGLSNHLVGFEGTMTLRDIEKCIYGNWNARLSYAPSSTIFSQALRHKKIRVGIEPRDKFGEPEGPEHWNKQRKELGIPDTHRLFTIVDTGDMSVSVIAAERPPVVALLCGREGGMLRALLCSWRFETNCLYRESVMRMRSSMAEQATPNDWLKISLASQGDVGRTRKSYVQQKENSLRSTPSLLPPTPPPKEPVVQQIATK